MSESLFEEVSGFVLLEREAERHIWIWKKDQRRTADET